MKLHNEIPGYENFTNIEPILEGVSGEDKYRVTAATGKKMFLRVGICENSFENYKKHMLAETLEIPIANNKFWFV